MNKTIGRLMEESIKLMFDNVGKSVSISTTAEYESALKDGNYARRLVNIFGAINSGISQAIKLKGIISKIYVSDSEKIALSLVNSEDIDTVLKMIGAYFYQAQYYIQNGECVVINPTVGAKYFIFYNQELFCKCVDGKYKDIDKSSSVTDTLDVPDDVFLALPFWIKGVLYEIDEPENAERAKKIFYELVKPKSHNFEVCERQQEFISLEREL